MQSRSPLTAGGRLSKGTLVCGSSLASGWERGWKRTLRRRGTIGRGMPCLRSLTQTLAPHPIGGIDRKGRHQSVRAPCAWLQPAQCPPSRVLRRETRSSPWMQAVCAVHTDVILISQRSTRHEARSCKISGAGGGCSSVGCNSSSGRTGVHYGRCCRLLARMLDVEDYPVSLRT